MEHVVSVVGLGCVGLPLAVAFSKVYATLGYDANEQRIQELHASYDGTDEITFTSRATDLQQANFHIVTVPTPITEVNQPDFSGVLKASETVGRALKPGDIVIYESSVFPGVMEDECVPVLEKISGLKCGKDFKAAYIVEWINPGENEHAGTVKVVSGQDSEAREMVAKVYEKVVTAGAFRAVSIKVAEAAVKAQQDFNAALMNELALILDRLDIDIVDVLEAVGTKRMFRSGQARGPCIGIDYPSLKRRHPATYPT